MARGTAGRILLTRAAALLLCAACRPAAEAPPPSETLRIVLRSDPASLDPFIGSTNVARMVGGLIFEPLIDVDTALAPAPRLAVEWRLEPGGDAWRFKLRPQVRWQSGGELQAADIATTLARALDPLSPAAGLKSLFQGAGPAEPLGPLEIRVPQDPASPVALLSWQRLPILPAHEATAATGSAGAPAGSDVVPAGSGPYRLSSWRRGEWILLERNPGWWGGQPDIRYILFRIVADPVTSSHALRSGEVDIAPARPADRLEALRPGSTFRVVEIEPGAVCLVLWNLRLPASPFADARVRRALTLGLNREAFVRSIRRGQARVAPTLYPPMWRRGRDGVEPLPYDPAQAARLLDEAGFTDGDGDGRRERGGAPLVFPLLYVTEDEVRRDAALLLHSDLSRLGVEVRLERVDAAGLVRRLRAHDFSAALHVWRLDAEPRAREFFHSSQAAAGMNYGGYSDALLDSLLDREAAAPTDAERARAGAAVEMRLREEAPALFICFPVPLIGVNRRVQGFEAGALGLLLGGPGPETWSLGGAGGEERVR